MHAAKEVGLLAKYRRDRVFVNTTLFQTFAERLVRKHVMLQLLEEGNLALEEECRLIRRSTEEIQAYLSKAKVRWRIPWATAKTVVVDYVRHVASERLKEEDLEPELESTVLKSIHREKLEGLFPSTWMDS